MKLEKQGLELLSNYILKILFGLALLLTILFLIKNINEREPLPEYKYINIQSSHALKRNFTITNTQFCINNVDDWGDLYGNSMQPTFFEGNTVIVKNYTNTTKIKSGDIIRFYRYNDQYSDCNKIKENTEMAVIHRVVAKYDNKILVQGDNLNEVETIDDCQVTHIILGILYT
jgi:hypothetical protein